MTGPNASHDIYTIILSGVEMIAALFRKARRGEISHPQAMRADRLRRDKQDFFEQYGAEAKTIVNELSEGRRNLVKL